MRSSVRIGTMFYGSCLTIMEIVRIVFHYFVRNYNATQAHLELKEIINARINPVEGRGSKLRHHIDDPYRLSYK